MRKFFLRFQDLQDASAFPWVILMSAFFLCGAVAGCIAAASINDVSGSTLTSYVNGYLSFVGNGAPKGSIAGYAFYNAYKYHAAVFLCGFSALGVLFIPLIAAARGFFLSFAVTSFVRLYGYNGLLFSAGVFGVQCLVSLPFLLSVSAQAFLASAVLMGVSAGVGKARGRPVFANGYFLRFGVCALALLLCALFETFVSPLIAASLAGLLI